LSINIHCPCNLKRFIKGNIPIQLFKYRVFACSQDCGRGHKEDGGEGVRAAEIDSLRNGLSNSYDELYTTEATKRDKLNRGKEKLYVKKYIHLK